MGTRHSKRVYCRERACLASRNRVRRDTQEPCITEGCGKAKGYASGYCNSCYYRVHRTGTIDRRQLVQATTRPDGYRKVRAPGHPTATASGHSMEHRKVVFDALAGAPPTCFWCAKALRWEAKRRSNDAVVVDHLNDQKGDNRPENLVPACNRCNFARGHMLPFLRAMQEASVPELLKMIEREAGTRPEAASTREAA